jgi:cytochrome c peroxidase
VRHSPDMVTPKLAALHFYQLALPAPTAPPGSFDPAAAARGQALFSGRARCMSCHQAPLFTEAGWNMHTGAEIGIDNFQADRAPDHRYRTTPLRGIGAARMKGGFYHDGRFATLNAVVAHYNTTLKLRLSTGQQNDLVQYLRSL